MATTRRQNQGMKAPERKKFARLVREHLASLGAVRADAVSLHARCDPDKLLLATRGGTLEVNLMSLDEATVFCNFSHPELAALVLRPDEFNPHSGKYNFHLDACASAAEAADHFARLLSLVVVPGDVRLAREANDRAAARFAAAEKWTADAERRWKFEGSTGALSWSWDGGLYGVQSPLSVAGDYVISHRMGPGNGEQHELCYRPTGEHHHVGTYASAVLAREAADAHHREKGARAGTETTDHEEGR